ncbi:hypothetical protein BS50DRAFT_475485, partial [Corynespora cassiicola Philippines]
KEMQTEVVDTMEDIRALVDVLVEKNQGRLSNSPPIMYIDIEGKDLCREGTMSIFTLLLCTGMEISNTRAYLIDVHVLGEHAFNTAGSKQKTLKDILQDGMIKKVFFDVRNDSDALFAHFDVALRGVEDVQLMESATRQTTPSRMFVSGLTKCIEQNLAPALFGNRMAAWKLAKQKGEQLFMTAKGGSYEVFNQRPMPAALIAYCVGDVQCLPKL